MWLHSSVGRASHRYRGGHGFQSRRSPDFFRLLLSNCLNWKIYCDDHSSLSLFDSGICYPPLKIGLFTISKDHLFKFCSWFSRKRKFSWLRKKQRNLKMHVTNYVPVVNPLLGRSHHNWASWQPVSQLSGTDLYTLDSLIWKKLVFCSMLRKTLTCACS